jgi:UDP-N-acetylmuramyl tripeptide synthase
VVLLQNDKEVELFDLKTIPWTFGATYKPSMVNLLHAAAALYGHFDGKLPQNFKTIMEATQLDPRGGRLTLFKAKSGALVLADYAHEKQSLREVARLGRSLVKNGGTLTAVVRLAYDRTPELIQETGRFIANDFDSFYVYDKVDGYWLKAEELPGRRFQKIEGHVSSLLSKAIAETNPNVKRIIREDEAIAGAAKNAKPNDVVVVIVNDDIDRSLGFIKSSFDAEEL